MKYSLLWVAVCTAFVGNAHAFTPKITGTLKAHLESDNYKSVQTNTTKNTVTTREAERNYFYGGSRIKVSGSEKINDTLTAAYSLEYNIFIDSDDKNNFTPRSTYASLDHKTYGRLRYGRMTSPENDFDIGVAQTNLIGGFLPFSSFGVRSNNALQYYTPYFGKDNSVRIKLHYGINESDSGTSVATYINNSRRTIQRDMAAAQIAYNDKTLGLGLSYSRAGRDFNAIAGMASYKKDRLGMATVARVADFNSGYKEAGVLGSLSYSMDNSWKTYGQFGYSQNFEGIKDVRLVNTALGVGKDFKLNSGRASVFAEVAGEFYTRTRTNSDGDTIDVKDTTYGIATGVNYRF